MERTSPYPEEAWAAAFKIISSISSAFQMSDDPDSLILNNFGAYLSLSDVAPGQPGDDELYVYLSTIGVH